ncbi:MAG: DUF4300 family protein [Filifactor alocis]|nr:DUF4300 family protein [Filifactor alocis]
MKKLILILATLSIFTACSSSQQAQPAEELPTDPSLSSVSYHNISNEASQNEVRELLKGRISDEGIDLFLNDVATYNALIPDLKSEYTEATSIPVAYDEMSIADAWEKSNPEFIGNNCRITTFGLIQDSIELNVSEDDPSNLAFDNNSLKTSKKFKSHQQYKFNTYYHQVPTENTRDIAVHVKKIQDYHQKIGLHYALPEDVGVISVVFHDTIDADNVHLFIGHTGLLVKEQDGYKFIEKLSFDLPYQIVRLKDKQQLNDYLMKYYDVSEDQETAKPFIMENGELLKEYRALSDTP